MSVHSEIRMQQRSIPALIIDLLINYGERKKSVGKCEVLFFNKPALKRLKQYLGKEFYSRIDKFKSAYLVQANNGEIVTVGHRTQSFKDF